MNENVADSDSIRVRLGCGNAYAILSYGRIPGGAGMRLVRVDMKLGKAGVCQGCLLGAVTELVNSGLAFGMGAEPLAKALEGHTCPEAPAGGKDRPLSCVDGLARLMRKGKL